MNSINNGNSHEIDTDENYTNIPLKIYQKDNIHQCETDLNKYDIQNVYNTTSSSRKYIQENSDPYKQYSLHRNNQPKHFSDAHQINSPCSSRKSIQDKSDAYEQYSLNRNNQTNPLSDAQHINIQTSLPKNPEKKNKTKHTTKIVKYYQSKCLYYYFFLTIINLIICFLYFLNILYDCKKTDFINDKILFGKIDFVNE
jgi:hypothetical protein